MSSLELATVHECLKNKEIYMDNNNVLFAQDEDNSEESYMTCHEMVPTSIESSRQSTKQSAVWTDNAVIALISLYETHMHMLDHPKKKSQIWAAISNSLKDFEIEMSLDQVRWKMNTLQKKYKECCDNNNKSGRGTMQFKWYNQMDEIFGKNKDAIAAHTVSSRIIKQNISEPALSSKENASCSSKSSTEPVYTSSPSTTSAVSIASSLTSNKRIRLKHGTGSNLANKKINIEQQWLQFLEKKEQRDVERDKKHEKSEERATENLTLKKQIVALKRKQIEQKKELSNKKLKDKENRHAEIMKIEEMKCKLLRKLLCNADMQNIYDSDE